jgi:hypothetical protein
MPLETFVRVDSVIDGNFDDISLVEFDLVVKALTGLKAGNEIEIPQVCRASPLSYVLRACGVVCVVCVVF